MVKYATPPVTTNNSPTAKIARLLKREGSRFKSDEVGVGTLEERA
jgi:hypothetical protein